MNKFSIIIPCFNESENIFKLVQEILDEIKSRYIFEIIIVDDCSTDQSKKVYSKFSFEENINILYNKKNMGQSYSLRKGMLSSKYETVLTIDGDGQNNPKDIPDLIEKYFSDNFLLLVSGIRIERKDSLSKIIASKLANTIRSTILRDTCKDTGCSLKVFNKKIFLDFEYFNGIHRFIPSLFEGYGHKVHYINVNHRKRLKGKSNYNNTQRLFKGINDIIRVRKILNSANKN